MSDDAVVDRVARALWKAQGSIDGFFDDALPSHRDSLRDQARAAIEAMDEPASAGDLIRGNIDATENAPFAPG